MANPANLRAQLEALIEAAKRTTPRPWESDGCMIDQKSAPFAEVVAADCKPCGWSGCSGARVEATEADLEYIALAANLAPALARFALAVWDAVADDPNIFLVCCIVCATAGPDPKGVCCPLAALERELREVSDG